LYLPGGASGKESACQCRRGKRYDGFDPWVKEDPLEEEMATHSSLLAWRIPWTEEPGGLQSMGSPRVRHDLANKHTHMRLAIKHHPGPFVSIVFVFFTIQPFSRMMDLKLGG